MRANWLRDRLTAAKKNAVMWVELADAIQEVFEKQVEPVIDRLRGMNSTFSMSEADLRKKVKELGGFFSISERVEIEDWPLALMQRQDEIRLKKTDYPLESTISREFAGLQIEWRPLYAPMDQVTYPYGSYFATKEQLEYEPIPADQWFLTARGVLYLPMTELTKAFPDAASVSEQTALFEETLSRLITPMIPLHIVYDGTQYFLLYTLIEADEVFSLGKMDIEQTMSTAKEWLEKYTYGKEDITELTPPMSNSCNYRYNYKARVDALPLDAWTIDRPLPAG